MDCKNAPTNWEECNKPELVCRNNINVMKFSARQAFRVISTEPVATLHGITGATS
jgi:hypothetical protein